MSLRDSLPCWKDHLEDFQRLHGGGEGTAESNLPAILSKAVREASQPYLLLDTIEWSQSMQSAAEAEHFLNSNPPNHDMLKRVTLDDGGLELFVTQQ